MMAVMPYQLWLAEAKRKYLLFVLTEAKGNQCKAAEMMHVHRNTTNRLLSESGITNQEIRAIRLQSQIERLQPHVSS